MSFSEDLRTSAGSLWEKTVTHPFVIELGDGTLPQEKFMVYFQQDHLFIRDWIALMCGAVSKAPEFADARPLADAIQGALWGEEGLFQEFFKEMGLSPEEVKGFNYLPTSFGYSGFLRRVASDGSFLEIITLLLGIEWPYLDWAQRLTAAGKRPENKYYQAWIDIHASQELEGFVAWMRGLLDKPGDADAAKLKSIFQSTLRYEYLFWEMAYRGETWPE